MNSQKISYPLSSNSLTVGKWEKEVIKAEKFKTVKIKIYPTNIQKELLDNIINVHRYVYNNALEYIKYKGYNPNFQELRNLLATENTKLNSNTFKYHSIGINKLKQQIKEESLNQKHLKELLKEEEESLKRELKSVPLTRNPLIKTFELKVSNEIRSNAIKSICDAYKTGFSNLEQGNIKFFNPTFKSKNEVRKCVELAASEISMKNDCINICPGKIKEHSLFRISTKNINKYKNLVIEHNSDLVKQKGLYYILVTVPTINLPSMEKTIISGIDPGVRTFLTSYNNKNEIIEYKHNRNYLKKLNDKIKMLKSIRTSPRNKGIRIRYRKKQINKIEKKKIDLTNTLHWNVINDLLKSNDIIFIGDIKSHDIVKNGKNKTLNRDFNDLKFYIFKKRFLYKASLINKRVYFINEAYTTQACSCCGNLHKNIGDSEIYDCRKCKKVFGRDENSAKNIMMKGIIEYNI
jgi:IS605 OrfB family transposase